MFGLSPIKILLIIAVVSILLGPDKLPEVAAKAGRAWRSLKDLQQKVESEIRTVVPDLPTSTELARYARSPVHLMNTLADKVTGDDEVDGVADKAPPSDIQASPTLEESPTPASIAPVVEAPPVRTDPAPVAHDPSLN